MRVPTHKAKKPEKNYQEIRQIETSNSHFSKMGKSLQKNKEEENEPFKEGSVVEVSSNEDGFRGAWYVAKVINLSPFSNKKSKGKAFVEYLDLLKEDGSTPLSESVDVSFVRPLPPTQELNDHTFEPFDVVDALYCDGWWKGVVTKVNTFQDNGDTLKTYSVIFEEPPDQMELSSSVLRFHFDWIGGKWVQPGKQKRMRGLKFRPGMAVEVNRSKDNSRDVWFPAAILKETGFNSFLVMYNNSSIIKDGSRKEIVDSFHIRPSPPKSKVKMFDILEKVEALCGLVWRAGFITKILTGNRYIVQIKGANTESELNHSEIRPRMHFINGKWVCSSNDRSAPSYSEELVDVTNNVERTEVAMQVDVSSAPKVQIEPTIPCVDFEMNLGEKSNSCNAISESEKGTQRKCNSEAEEESTSCNAISESKRGTQRKCNSEAEAALSHPLKRLKMEDPVNLSNSSRCHAVSMAIVKPLQDISVNDHTLAVCSNNQLLGDQVSAESESSFARKNIEINHQEAALEDETRVSTVDRNRLSEYPIKSQNLSKAGLEDTSKQDSIFDIAEVERIAKEVVFTVCASEGTRGTSPETSCQLPDEEIEQQNEVEDNDNQQQKGNEKYPAGNIVAEMDLDGSATKEAELPGVEGAKSAGCNPGSPVNQFSDPSERQLDVETLLPEPVQNVPINSELVDVAMVETFCFSSRDSQPLTLFSKGHSPDSPMNQLNDASETEKQLEIGMHSPVLNVPINNQLADVAMAETLCHSSSDGLPLSSPVKDCLGCADNPVNHLDDASQRPVEIVMQSPVVSARFNSELAENPETPFKKMSTIWKAVESLEAFRSIPQSPHFRPLAIWREHMREGLAIGLMVSCATLVEKTSKLSTDDPRSILCDYLDELPDLKEQGFDVKPIENRLNNLLSIKDKLEQLHHQSNENKRKLTGCGIEKTKLEDEIDALSEKISELQKKKEVHTLLKNRKDSEIDSLKLDDSVTNQEISETAQAFKRLVGASWKL